MFIVTICIHSIPSKGKIEAEERRIEINLKCCGQIVKIQQPHTESFVTNNFKILLWSNFHLFFFFFLLHFFSLHFIYYFNFNV